MATSKGDVSVSIGVDNSGVAPALASTTAEFDRLGQHAERSGHGLGSLSELLREYRSEERMQTRNTKFFANELQNLLGASNGAAGALGKLIGVMAGGVTVGGLVFEGVKWIAEAYVEEKKRAEEATAEAKKWGDQHLEALQKVTQGFRDLAVAQASAGLGAAARNYVTQYQELQRGTKDRPGLQQLEIEAIDARAKVDELRAAAARARELDRQPRSQMNIGAPVDYAASAKMFERQAREAEEKAVEAESRRDDLRAELAQLTRDYQNTGRTLDQLAQDDKDRLAKLNKGAPKDANAWLEDLMAMGQIGGQRVALPYPQLGVGPQLRPAGPSDTLNLTQPHPSSFMGGANALWVANPTGAIEASDEKLKKDLAKNEKAIEQFGKQAQRNMQNLLGDQLGDILTGEWDGSLDKMVKSWGKMLMRMMAQALAADILGAIFGGPAGAAGGGLFSGLFGGKRAAGGPVISGRTYLVGERGPELFTADMSGRIVSNDALTAGGGTVVHNWHVQTLDAASFRDFLRSQGKGAVLTTLRELAADGRI